MKMAGKVCVVTGGGRGIGKAIVEKFLEYGAECVYAVDLNQEALAELESEHANVKGVALSVTDTAAVNGFAAKVRRRAGSTARQQRGCDQGRPDPQDERRGLAVRNRRELEGPFVMTRAIGPMMMEQGKGAIVPYPRWLGWTT